MLENGRITYYGTAAEDYSSDVYTERAIDVLRHAPRSSRPFFLWLSYFAPHEGLPWRRGDPPAAHTWCRRGTAEPVLGDDSAEAGRR